MTDVTRRRPTSRDVAALAGVSVATVSYVMNGHDWRVAEETRRRVLAAADELAYMQSSSARSLRLQRTERVCLVVGALGVPAYDRLARDLNDAADQVGYGVITIVVDSERRAQKAVELLHQRVADGAVVVSSGPYLPAGLLRTVVRSRLPLVVMSNSVRPNGFDVVRTSEAQACEEALDHLFQTDRRRVAYLGHADEFGAASGSERLEVYNRVLDRHGVVPEDRVMVSGADERVAAYRSVDQLLQRSVRPDAIFASSDRAAIAALSAVRDAGLVVPDDVAVIGVGNIEEGLITKPALSSVGPPSQDYCDVARLLFDRVLAKESSPDRELTETWSFIRRGSA